MVSPARGVKKPLRFLLLGLVALGWNGEYGRPANAQRGGPPKSAKAGAGATPSVKEIMTRLAKGPNSLTPVIGEALKANPPAWKTIQSQTKEYAKLASALGRNEVRKGTKESWKELTDAFAESAAELDKAAQAKDRDAAVLAHDQLKNSCMSCHQAHRGGGPGGGGPGGGGPGGPGGPGGGGPGGGGPPPQGAPNSQAGQEARSDTAEGAVNSFLDALAQNDAKALAAAVSSKAPAEVSIRAHKKTFAAILGKSLPTAEVKALAEDFDGFTVAGPPTVGSSGKTTVPLANGSLRRKVYVRKDPDGWRVVDYTGKVDTAPKG